MIDQGKQAKESVEALMDSFVWLCELEDEELREMAEELDFLHVLVIEELNERE